MQESSENVTGPGNGLIPLLAVLALAVASAGTIWGLHKKLYNDPLDPIRPVAAQPLSQGH